MSQISRFILQAATANLTIEYIEKGSTTKNSTEKETAEKSTHLSYEYLRAFSPAQIASKQIIGNKKLVRLNNIENVGKHGFRLNFNDDHSCIYTAEYFDELNENFVENWQKYENLLANNKMTREAKIDILNLS